MELLHLPKCQQVGQIQPKNSFSPVSLNALTVEHFTETDVSGELLHVFEADTYEHADFVELTDQLLILGWTLHVVYRKHAHFRLIQVFDSCVVVRFFCAERIQ